MRVVIKDAEKGTVLADASDAQVLKAEGNWYVSPEAVTSAKLVLTSHEYVCPYKGRCFYVDAVDGERRLERIAWVYDDPKTGWEHIKGKYGFYAGESAKKLGKTRDEVTE